MTSVWRTADGATVFSRQGSSIARAPDIGTHGMIATGSDGGDVDIWTSEGKRVALLPHSNQSHVRFLASGRLLVTAAMDGLVRVWDIAPALPRSPAFQLNGGENAYQLAFSPDGKALALSSLSRGQGAVRVFDVETGVPEAPSFANLVSDFEFSRDGRRLATATNDRLARVWDVQTAEPVSAVVQHKTPASMVKFSPDGKTVASAGRPDYVNGGELRVWDARSGAMLFNPLYLDGTIVSLEFTPDGRRLLTATRQRKGNLTLWDAQTGGVVARASHAMTSLTELAQINHTGSEVWSAGDDQLVRVWLLSDPRVAPAAKLLLSGAPTVLRLSPNDRSVAVGTFGGEVRIGDTRTVAVNASPMQHTGPVYATAFSPDSSVLVTSAGDGAARAWDVLTGEPLTPWLPTGVQFPRYASVAPGGRAWSYVGEGVFLEPFETDDSSVPDLVVRAELEAAQTLTAAALHTPLSAADVEARWQAGQTDDKTTGPRGELWLRWLARFEWMRGRMPEVLNALQELRSITPLRWPEVMQRLGAFASLGRWNDAIDELEGHRPWYAASPEFPFFEVIARLRSGDAGAAATVCRQQLSSYGDTENPDRASWIVRTCLLAQPQVDLDWQAVGRLAHITPEVMRERTTRAMLTSAVFVRQGRFDDAVEQFTKISASGRPSSLASRLFLALAEARAGRLSSARSILEQTNHYQPDAIEAHSWLRPWFHAEAELLRAEVIAALAPPRPGLAAPRTPPP